MQLIMLESLMKSTAPVPVPVSVSSSTDATGVRAVGHVSGADKLENQSHYLHCATVAQTDLIIITHVPHTHTHNHHHYWRQHIVTTWQLVTEHKQS